MKPGLAAVVSLVLLIFFAGMGAAQTKTEKIRIGYATRALRAIVRGVHLFKTRKEDTIRILSKFLGTKDRDALEESWDYAAKMPMKPYAVESAVQAVLDHFGGRASALCPAQAGGIYRRKSSREDR